MNWLNAPKGDPRQRWVWPTISHALQHNPLEMDSHPTNLICDVGQGCQYCWVGRSEPRPAAISPDDLVLGTVGGCLVCKALDGATRQLEIAMGIRLAVSGRLTRVELDHVNMGGHHQPMKLVYSASLGGKTWEWTVPVDTFHDLETSCKRPERRSAIALLRSS